MFYLANGNGIIADYFYLVSYLIYDLYNVQIIHTFILWAAVFTLTL